MADDIDLISAANWLRSYLTTEVAVVFDVNPTILNGVKSVSSNVSTLPSTVTLLPSTASTTRSITVEASVEVIRMVSPTENPSPDTPANVTSVLPSPPQPVLPVFPSIAKSAK